MLSITIDQDIEERLEALGATTKTSKVALALEKLRQVLAEVPGPRREDNIAEQYRRAYGEGGGLGKEFEGWELQGVWPPE